MNKYYITTPIYYPNEKPHVGTVYSTLLADVAARWHRLAGQEVFFMTGTDEHGQKIQEKAQTAGKEPKAFVDGIVPIFKSLFKLYDIDYTKFIRTTDPEHAQGVIAWVQKMIDLGDIYKSTYTGWYCVPDETFVTVNVDSIRDEKGHYLCPNCQRELRELSEESYFFRLSAYEEKLLSFYEQHPDFITPKDRINEVISFVKSGLKDLSISRKSVTWGIPFPGDPEQTIYVWADALNNYLTGIGYGQSTPGSQEQFAKFWPADVQVMAKDIVRFHAVFWPAFLMAADLPMPKKLLVHGYILIGDQKMSKSLGNVVDPELLATWYGVEPVRYYLLRQMPITQDGHFDLKDLEDRIEADLANSLGNLLNRMLTLSLNNGLDGVKPPIAWEAASAGLREKCSETVRIYCDEMEKYYFHTALAQVWKFIAEVNAYFHSQQPWVLAKQNKELFAEVISATAHSLNAIAFMLWPVMPKKMEAMLAALGRNFELDKNYEEMLRENVWGMFFKLTKIDPLFIKPVSHVEKSEMSEQPSVGQAEVPAIVQSPEIGIEDFAKVEMVVGTILACEPVKGSDKLYRLQIDLGPLGKRQIFSGVAKYFTVEELIGKQGVFVVNLKPRKMMGEMSQGMMLAAKDDKGVLRILTVGQPVENGAKVS